MKTYLSPSLLAADHERLNEEILRAEKLGAEYIHFDVMDNIFVPNTSFGVESLRQIHNIHNMVNDVHIMIVEPLKHIKEYMDAGADILTFHYEACENDEQVQQCIDLIHSLNGKAGLSIKPNTSVEKVLPFLKDLDLVLVMSVEPGFGGQSFMPMALDKISFLRREIDLNKYKVLIEVDGGINDKTGPLCKQAGVDILVAGSYLFGHEDMKERMDKIR